MDLKNCLSIDPTAIDEEMVRQPAIFAYFCEQRRLAEQETKQRKLALDVRIAHVERQIRLEAQARGEKLTERGIEVQVTLDESVNSLRLEIIRHEANLSKFDAIIKALAQKKDLLIALASNQRQERYQAFTGGKLAPIDITDAGVLKG